MTDHEVYGIHFPMYRFGHFQYRFFTYIVFLRGTASAPQICKFDQTLWL